MQQHERRDEPRRRSWSPRAKRGEATSWFRMDGRMDKDAEELEKNRVSLSRVRIARTVSTTTPPRRHTERCEAKIADGGTTNAFICSGLLSLRIRPCFCHCHFSRTGSGLLRRRIATQRQRAASAADARMIPMIREKENQVRPPPPPRHKETSRSRS